MKTLVKALTSFSILAETDFKSAIWEQFKNNLDF